MRGTLTRILNAIANALRGFWRATVHAGRITFAWVRETAAPALWEVACDAGDACLRTAKGAIHFVPNMLSRLVSSGPAVAPAPSSDVAAPLDVQRQDRQALLDRSEEDGRKRGVAITVRAAARALLRDQEPVGVPAPIRMWLSSLQPQQMEVLARMSTEEIMRALDGSDDQPLGTGYQAATWENDTRSEPVRVGGLRRTSNPIMRATIGGRRSAAAPILAIKPIATSIADFRAHVAARTDDLLQRRLRGSVAIRADEGLGQRVVGR